MSAKEIINAELSGVERIIRNETWLASEKAGHPVDRHSPEVQQRVADILLNGGGEYLRNFVDHQ